MIEGLFADNNFALEKSLLNFGNFGRIKNVIEKARSGKPITLAFLGGSITEGAGAGEGKNYVRCVSDFWQESFPLCEITSINAGIGATGSILGVFRMERSVLSQKPDVLVIDHSVNDNGDEGRLPGSTRQTYECVIRRGLMSGAAVVPICFCLQDGACQRDMNLQLAKHYDLPFISVTDGVYEALVASGKYPWSDYSVDTVHPNAHGHKMAAELLINYFKKAMADESVNPTDEYEIPAPLFGESYMDTEFLAAADITPISMGDFKEGDFGFGQFKGGWICENVGNPIVFSLKNCKRVHVAYVREVSPLAGVAEITANGENHRIDSYFADGWGDYSETSLVFDSEKSEDVTLSIKNISEGKRFAILRILVAR